MMCKTVHVNPGGTVILKVIEDADAPKNAKSFRDQSRQQSIRLKVVEGDHVQVCQAGLIISQVDIFSGDIKAYR